jgi:aminopeptidase
MTNSSRDEVLGAIKILRRSLGLMRGETFTIFYDETGWEAAEVLIRAALAEGFIVRQQFVSEAAQAQGYQLCAADLEAISAARAVLACLSDSTESTPFRAALIRSGTDRRRRFGHMPGARMEVLLATAASDDEQIERRCDDLCLALTLTREALLTTYLGDGRAVHLKLNLGGLARPSIQSTGKIPLNTWGNIPGGESFIAPLEDTAEGEFVINGSIRGMVVPSDKNLLLLFRRGRIAEVHGDGELRRHFEQFFAYARERKDAGYDRLAELGVGVNDGIQELTGSSLLDEKCTGTAHIAIGTNTGFGGSITSCIHEDLVTRNPSLLLDGKSILDRGSWLLDPREWREPLLEIDPLFPAGGCIIRRASLISAVKRGERLLSRRKLAAGRSSRYTVAEGEAAEVLLRLYRHIPDINASIRCDRLFRLAMEREHFDDQLTGRILALLARHGMIEIKEFASLE